MVAVDRGGDGAPDFDVVEKGDPVFIASPCTKLEGEP